MMFKTSEQVAMRFFRLQARFCLACYASPRLRDKANKLALNLIADNISEYSASDLRDEIMASYLGKDRIVPVKEMDEGQLFNLISDYAIGYKPTDMVKYEVGDEDLDDLEEQLEDVAKA